MQHSQSLPFRSTIATLAAPLLTALAFNAAAQSAANPAAHSVATARAPAKAATPVSESRWIINTNQSDLPRVLAAIERAVGTRAREVRPMLQPGSQLLTYDLPALAPRLRQVDAMVSTLASIPGVKFASPDIALRPVAAAVPPPVPTPSDALYAPAQAGYMDTGNYASLRMPSVWGITRGSAAQVIAVLDTGVLFEHPELRGRLLPGYDFVSQSSPTTGTQEAGTVFTSGSNDGDGRDADPSDPGDAAPPGYLCSAGDPGNTSSFHGTSVASVAAAQSNNGQLLTGMDWNARVLPLRVAGRCGIATSADIIDAMYWAAGLGNGGTAGLPANPNPARIINLSFASNSPLGSSCTGASGAAFALAFNDVRSAGVSMVVAAGNSGGAVEFPASCPGVIAAGAVRQTGLLPSYTSKGASGSDLVIMAPGDATAAWVAANNSGLADGRPDPAGHNAVNIQGTSFAAPMIAGLVSLLRSVKSDLSPSQVVSTLEQTALAYPPRANLCRGVFGIEQRCDCTANSCGAGIINPLDAVSAARELAPTAPISNVPQAQATSGSTATLDAGLSTDSTGTRPAQGGRLVFKWRQVFGQPVQASGIDSEVLQVTGGLSGNIGEFLLTTTDTATNATSTATVRVIGPGVVERTFVGPANSGFAGAGPAATTGSTSGGAPSSATSPNESPMGGAPSSADAGGSGGGGGGGGAFGLLGLCGLMFTLLAYRKGRAPALG